MSPAKRTALVLYTVAVGLLIMSQFPFARLADGTLFPQERESAADHALQATNSALMAAGEATLEALPSPTPLRDPQTYRIVYLLAPEVIPAESIQSPETFNQFASVLTAYSWEDVLQYQAEAPVEALIVHQSAFEMIDTDWTTQASRHGLVIAGINLQRSQWKQLFGSHCGKTTPEISPGYENGDFWMSYLQLTRFTNPDDRDKWYEAQYVTCTKYKTAGMGLVSSGGSPAPLRYANHAEYMMRSITGQIDVANDWNASGVDRLADRTLHAPESTSEVNIQVNPDTTPAERTPAPDDFVLQATNAARVSSGLPTLSPFETVIPSPTRDPRTYQIVYLIADGAVPADRAYSPETMAQDAPIKVAHTWDEVLRYDSRQPIEALIIHASAQALIDDAWTAQAARRGIIFGTISLTRADVDQLYGSRCRENSPVEFPAGFSQESYWIMSYRLDLFSDPGEAQKWWEARYITCTRYKPKGGRLSSGSGSQGDFARPGDRERFMSELEFRIDELRNAREKADLQFGAIQRDMPLLTATPVVLPAVLTPEQTAEAALP